MATPPSNMPLVAAAPPAADRKLLAPWWHTIVLVLFVFATTLFQTHSAARLDNRHIASRVGLYCFMICFELALLAYVWFGGVRRCGTKFTDVIGGKWTRAADAWRDIGIAFIFWMVVLFFLGLAGRILGQNNQVQKIVTVLMPRSTLETILWVAMSISAGFCEEFTFRGYLQKQFFAATGSNAVAIAVQAIVFGAAHGYQGVKGMITITLYGALFGILAMMRKSLRPGMIQHAMQDACVPFFLRLANYLQKLPH